MTTHKTNLKLEEVKPMLNDILFRVKKLSDWEKGFFNSICMLPDSILADLSQNQQKKLFEIWDRVTDGPIVKVKDIGELK